jgi:hypothetical protein
LLFVAAPEENAAKAFVPIEEPLVTYPGELPVVICVPVVVSVPVTLNNLKVIGGVIVRDVPPVPGVHVAVVEACRRLDSRVLTRAWSVIPVMLRSRKIRQASRTRHEREVQRVSILWMLHAGVLVVMPKAVAVVKLMLTALFVEANSRVTRSNDIVGTTASLASNNPNVRDGWRSCWCSHLLHLFLP